MNRWYNKLSLDEKRQYNHDSHIRLTQNTPPRKCLICGNPFKSRRKSVKVCSPRCRAYLINFPDCTGVRTPEMDAATQEKRAKHPKTGPFITNCQSKYWSILSPDGCNFQFWNLELFVRENKEMFNGEDVVQEGYKTLAAHQLRRLRPDRSHSINSWKGWTWHYILDLV